MWTDPAAPRSACAPTGLPLAPALDGLRVWLLRRLTLTQRAILPPAVGTAEVAAWSPNGRYLAAGYASGNLVLWDMARLRVATIIWQAHRQFVNALTFSPDGRWLASAASDGRTRLWQIGAAGALAAAWTTGVTPHPPHLPAVAFSPDGRLLATADGEQTITLWDLGLSATGTAPRPRPLRRLVVPGHTTALGWSPAGACLAAGTLEGRVLLWQTWDPGDPIGQSIASPVYALAWAPAGRSLAAGGADGAVRLLDGATLALRATLLAPYNRSPSLRVPDYGQPLQGAQSGQPKPAVGGAINGLGWSPSGDILAVTATGVPLRLWQPSRGTVAATYWTEWDMNAVSWSPDGRSLAMAADDGRIRVLGVADPSPTLTNALCRMAGGIWCGSLLSARAGGIATPGAPTSYMSR